MGTTKKNNAEVYEHNGLTLDDTIIYNYEVRHKNVLVYNYQVC